jgi:hypothetical protein
MGTFLGKTFALAVSLSLLVPGLACAASGAASKLILVADTRGLKGLQAWLANIYNESHLQFALLTIVVIPVGGLILGLLADLVLGWVGLDLKSRELAEH